jgi:glycosyltransferase involved in cell wall biosynthesis
MFQGFYPQQITSDKIRILPPPLAKLPEYQKKAPSSVAPLKIALLGNFGISKGQDFAIELFDRTRDLPIEFLILGHLSETARLAIKKRNLKHVSVHGSFERGEMPKLLDGFSLSLHVSPWPETYCMTLSESWQLKLVPVVTDTGALGERVQNEKNGFKVPVGDLDALVKLLEELIQNPGQIEAVRAQVSASDLMSEEDHIAVVGKEFSEIISKYPSINSLDPAPLVLDLTRIGIELNHRQWLIRSGMRSKNPHSLLNSPFSDILRKSISYVKHHGVLNTLTRAMRELNGGERK